MTDRDLERQLLCRAQVKGTKGWCEGYILPAAGLDYWFMTVDSGDPPEGFQPGFPVLVDPATDGRGGWKMGNSYDKPPVGAKQCAVVESDRVQQLAEAITRYAGSTDGGKWGLMKMWSAEIKLRCEMVENLRKEEIKTRGELMAGLRRMENGKREEV